MNAVTIQGYDKEQTVINGNKIERIYFAGESIAFSEIVFEGKDHEDAIANFYAYFKSSKTWYVSGNELKYM